MELKELLQFIDFESDRSKKYFYKGCSKRERVLSRTVKLTEELGELCDEVLAFNGSQRKEKQEKYRKNSLPDEFADVVLTAFLLAKAMDIDIEKALEKKIRKINNRKY